MTSRMIEEPARLSTPMPPLTTGEAPDVRPAHGVLGPLARLRQRLRSRLSAARSRLMPGRAAAASASNSIALALLNSLREPLAFAVRHGDQIVLNGGNPALERLLGRTAAELSGLALARVLAAPIERVERAMAHGRPARFPAHALDRFGAARRVTVRVEPVGVLDGTAATQALVYLDPLDAELEDLRGVATRLQSSDDDLKRQAARLARMQQELEDFGSMLSHDLRAPLRSIDGFARLLAEDHADRLDRSGQEQIDRIRTAVARLNRMIEALRELSSVTARNIARVPVDLSAVAQDVAAELQRGRPGRPARFVIGADLNVHGDPAMLRVLLQNLIDNALKFSARRDDALIEIGAVTDPAGRRSYVVRDNGEGFDMRFSERLFGPFQRLHAADEFPGTGIGLATARQIVRRHGGEIWARGEPGGGASFHFTLPAD